LSSSTVLAANKKIKMIKVATSSLGSGTYSKATIFSGVVKKSTGVNVRVMPNDSQVGVGLTMRAKEMDCAYYTGTGMFYLAHGLEVFSAPEWGPQPIRSTLMGMAGCAFGVSASSDIKTWKDMKGKRVAVSPGTPIVADATFAFLAYGGITPKDVKQVVVSGMGGAYNALLDGTTDGAFLPFEGSASYKMEGSPKGLRWLPMELDNKEGWKRLQKYLPMYGPFVGKSGAGISEKKPVIGGGYILGFFAYDNADIDVIYLISKAVYNGYEMYKAVSDDLKYWDRGLLLNYEKQILPFHDGTIKFLKEIGKWTPQMEKWQAYKLEQEKKRKLAWSNVVKDAKAKKIKIGSKGFKAMWLNYLWSNNLLSTPGAVPAN
jgi:TRAP transporter TAXI family solute receptor